MYLPLCAKDQTHTHTSTPTHSGKVLEGTLQTHTRTEDIKLVIKWELFVMRTANVLEYLRG